MVVKEILEACELSNATVNPVSGGDINETFCAEWDGKKYFLKINDASKFPAMLVREASGLNTLRQNSSLLIPEVLKTGVKGDRQYLLLEWIESETSRKNFWWDFGKALAEMHKKPQPFFGFHEDNYIGSLEQKNSPQKTWSEFYAVNRILSLSKKLRDNNSFSSSDCLYAEKFCAKLDHLFPKETPSLLHGDLWSGNFMTAKSGQVSVFDPAVYYGHREMDLGMTKLFGGFSKEFYEGYEHAFPLENNWNDRVQLSQIYPLLVHSVLFGGSYIASAKVILKKHV